MKIPFVTAFFSYLLATTARAINFNERKKGDLDEVKLDFDKMSKGDLGELSKLNYDCISTQYNFDINSVSKTSRNGMAEAEWHKINFSANGLKGTKLSIADLTRHESVHATMRIINERFNSQLKKPGLPYSNEEEERQYKEALKDFNDNLQSLESKLAKSLRTKKKLDEKTQAIVDKLTYPKEVVLPYDPRLISLPVGVSSFRVGVLDDLDNFPVIVTEKPKKIKTYEGLDAVSLSLKHPDKTANALSLIKKYRDAFKVVPQENFHVEQPAYMIHYLEPVIEDISKPMMDYMKKRILKCSASPTKPQGIRAAELSKDLGVDL